MTLLVNVALVLILVLILTLNAIGTVVSVGHERKPVSAALAGGEVALCLALIVGIILFR